MKRINILIIAGIFFLIACVGEHNQAPNKGLNLSSKRIYGNRGGLPLQLPNKYKEDDGKMMERANKIREKLFPR